MDLNETIKSIEVITRNSKKTGNDYTVLSIAFHQGYTYETFISNEQVFILGMLLPKADDSTK